jgi:AcrR family transcriptional regulator
LERLRRGAVAYVLFAIEHRREFELMFGGVGVDLAQEPRLLAAAQSAFDPLVSCLQDCSEAGLLRADPVVAERLIWSAAHGYASLWNSVPELMRGSRSDIRRNAELMLAAALQGLEGPSEVQALRRGARASLKVR